MSRAETRSASTAVAVAAVPAQADRLDAVDDSQEDLISGGCGDAYFTKGRPYRARVPRPGPRTARRREFGHA